MKPNSSIYKKSFHFALFFYLSLCTVGMTRAERMMDSVDTFSVARNAAYMRIKDGDFAGALSAEEKALRSAEDRFGKLHPSIVPVLNDVAVIHRYLGHYAQAETDFKWGLAIREKTLGPDDPLVAESLSHLAALYDDWGRWQEGEFFAQRALTIREEQPVKSPRDISQALI